MGDDVSSPFSEDEMKSKFYRWRNEPNTPKRIKFIVFSNKNPSESTGRTDIIKRCNEKFLDADYLYLKKEFFDKFASTDESKKDDHIEFLRNRKEEELWEKLENFAQVEGPELVPYDCYVFVFLTFLTSTNTSIHFHDVTVPLDKIWEKVSQISAMRGKPKIFLVQADNMEFMPTEPMKTKGGVERYMEVLRKIPTDADKLTIMSTIPGEGFVAGKMDPSFLIQAFVEALNDNKSKQMDLLSLTVEMNQKVSKMILKSKVEKTMKYAKRLPIPYTESTLRKLLVLP